MSVIKKFFTRSIQQLENQDDIKILKTFESIVEAAKYMNCNAKRFCPCLAGKIKKFHGFRWRYTPLKIPLEEIKIPFKTLSEFHGYRFYEDGKVWNDLLKFWIDPSTQ